MSKPSENNAIDEKHAPAMTGSVARVTNLKVNPDQRKRRLVKKESPSIQWKYNIWFYGHITTIVFGSVYFIMQLLWLQNRYYIQSICYRLSLMGAMLALFGTISHKFGVTHLPPLPALLSQENFQYLVLSVAWFFTFKSIIKILPFYLVSVLQFSHHKGIKQVNDQLYILASIIAYDELLLVVYLLLRTLFFRKTSGYQLSLVLGFLWLRVLYNPQTRAHAKNIVNVLDAKVMSTKNEKITKPWANVKEFLEHKAA